MMGTVAAGARSAGAHTLGVMPESMMSSEIADADSDEFVVTDGMAARKTVLIAKSDAFLALPGGLGTLDELFEVWTTATLRLHAKPMVALNVDGFYTGLMAWLHDLVSPGFVRSGAVELLQVVDSVPAAFEALAAGV